jgi:CDP-glucose 4,6-dehydratase
VEKTLFSSLRRSTGPLLITGHTGFKGAWLIGLLTELEIPAVGYSLPPEANSLYERAGLQGAIPEIFADIRDEKALLAFMDQHQPSNVLHMAAQPLVLKSYQEPVETFSVNVMGTAKVLQNALNIPSIRNIGVVTTDKVYENQNLGKRFVETDPLAGKDPYSASKVGTEAVVAAWQQISKINSGPRIVSLRAGNVIGGGDFAENRIVPDLVRGYLSDEKVEIRNPGSTRPWQHALDPLIGYLHVLDQMDQLSPAVSALNFGPSESSLSVSKLVEFIHEEWSGRPEIFTQAQLSVSNLEAVELGLDSTAASSHLNWKPCVNQEEAIRSTARWWRAINSEGVNPRVAMRSDVEQFLEVLSESR